MGPAPQTPAAWARAAVGCSTARPGSQTLELLTLRHPEPKGEVAAIGGVEDLDLVWVEPDLDFLPLGRC